eukprot:g677.t1
MMADAKHDGQWRGRRDGSLSSRGAMNTQPQVYVFGEIEGAVPNWPLRRLYCSWRLVFDPNKFGVIEGETEGETFTSHVGEGFCVWNQPLALKPTSRSRRVTAMGEDARAMTLASSEIYLDEDEWRHFSLAMRLGSQGVKESLKMSIFEKVYAHMGNEIPPEQLKNAIVVKTAKFHPVTVILMNVVTLGLFNFFRPKERSERSDEMRRGERRCEP